MESYQPGQEIENHRLLERIEEGLGHVWKADFLGQIVALKLLPEEVCDQRKTSIETLYQLSHLAPPNNRYFIPFEHMQLSGPHRYIRMKWIEGVSLANYLKQNPTSEINKVLPLAKQILKGLEVLHRQKITHQHLTPQNIFLPYGGTPLLMNLQLLSSKQTPLSSLEKEYLAPECLVSEPKGSPAGDIFSFGKIFYVLLTGDSPSSFKPLSTFSNLHLPEKSGIEVFLQKCVATDPSNRFQNATQALKALDELHFEVRRKSDAKWEPALFIPMILALLFVIFYMMPKFMSNPQDKPENWYIRAEEAFEVDKDYQTALSLFEKALPLYQSDYRIYRDIGWCHYHLEQFERAKDALTKSIEYSPQQGETWYALAKTLEKIIPEQAEEAYLQSLQCQPPYQASYEKVYLLFQKKLETLFTSTELQKYPPSILEQARQLFQQSQKTEQTATSSGFVALGRCFLMFQKQKEAETLLQFARQLQPESGEVLFYLGMIWEKEDPQKANNFYREATKTANPHFYTYVHLGYKYLLEWKHLLAEEQKTNRLRDPAQEKEWKKIKENLLTKAEKSFLSALQKTSFSEAHFGLGEVYFHLEDDQKAISHYRQVSSDSTSHYAQALFSLALCYHKLQEKTKARDCLEQLRTIHPEKAVELEKLLNF